MSLSVEYRGTVVRTAQRSIAFLDTHTKIMSDFPLQRSTY